MLQVLLLVKQREFFQIIPKHRHFVTNVKRFISVKQAIRLKRYVNSGRPTYFQ